VALRPGILHAAESAQHKIDGFIVHDAVYPPSIIISRHDHELASVCVVVAGGYYESFGRKERYAIPGTVIVHPAGEHHADRHEAVQTRILTIEIEAAHLAALRSETRIFDEPWHRKDDALAIFGTRVAREMRRRDGVSALTIESLVLELIATAGLAQLAEARGARWLLRVRDYLEANTGGVPSLDQLAIVADVHPVHIARAFRQAFGCSVGTYARRLQVARAVALLQQGHESLSTIAHQIGFADQSHMSRMVRAQTGLTPGNWRRNDDG
jgi:AraC family transcriptional regulator